MNTTSCKAWWRLIGGVIFFMAYVSTSFGQDNSTAQPVASALPVSATDQSAELASFRQEQRALAREKAALVAQGATPDQLQTWRTQNATRLAAQRQRAKDMAAGTAAHPAPIISEVEIPEGASQEMADFLTTRADLANHRAQLHNDKTANAEAVFHEQNGAEIEAQKQRMKDFAAQSAQRPRPVPGPLALPAGAPQPLQAFLTLRHQLLVEEAQVWNQNLAAGPAARNEAVAQWRQQNAAQFQQMQALAKNLKASSSRTQTIQN